MPERKKIWKLVTIALVLLSTACGIGAAKYFAVSNTISDEIDILVDNRKKPMQLSYAPEGVLGEENKTVRTGVWENFSLKLTNESHKDADPWENIFIRIKLFNVDKESVNLGYLEGETWNEVETYDLKSVGIKNIGTVSDLGPKNGLTVEPKEEKEMSFHIRFEEPNKNTKIEIEAITKSPENLARTVTEPSNYEIIEPSSDTYFNINSLEENNYSKDYLEISTGENKNSYALFVFRKDRVPNQFKSAVLNIFQYWGSGFSELRESGVHINAIPVKGRISNKNFLETDKIPVKSVILGNRRWYQFNLTDFLKSLERNSYFSILLKFGTEDYDNTRGRIRFVSIEGKNPPYLTVHK